MYSSARDCLLLKNGGNVNISETKFKETGKLKLDNYVIFEKVRNNRDGGGLAFGCIPELSPVWVRKGEEDKVESLSVNIFVKNYVT